MAFNVYQSVTDSIVAQLERGTAPWRKPWASDAKTNASFGLMPVRHNFKPYNGINVLLLWSAMDAFGYTSNVFMTYKQAAALGGQVRKGEKSTQVFYANTLKKEVVNTANGKVEEKNIFFMKGFAVFNADQIDNLPEKYTKKHIIAPQTPKQKLERNNNCEAFIKKVGPKYKESNDDRAYYMPSVDKINMPHFDNFMTAEHYYSTLFHETVHWSGHKTRLDRLDNNAMFGDSSYAFEELVAEIGAAFLCAMLNVSNEVRTDHADYLASWLKGLKNDPKAIFKAASLASKAVNFILDLGGISYDEEMAEAA